MPVDYNPMSAVDEWSGDYGCGVKYFSQDAVIILGQKAGVDLDKNLTPGEKLKIVQSLLKDDDYRARQIFETIGHYLGYSIANYCNFYDVKHVLILGRVTSGEGGNIILETANKIIEDEFNQLANNIQIHLPDESSRRVGQSIAAASLPEIK